MRDPVLLRALLVCLVAFGLTLLWVLPAPHAWICCAAYRLRWRYCRGCCSSCDGSGSDASAPETGGRCWDCYGTGHLHP